MTKPAREKPASLVQTVSTTILIAAVLSLVLQLSISLAKNFGNERNLSAGFLKLETKRILHALHLDGGIPRLKKTTELNHYRGEYASTYAFRVFDIKGQIIASSNQELFPPSVSLNGLARFLPDLWLYQPSAPPLFQLSGGQKHLLANVPIWIEIATKGDPAGLRYQALWTNVIEDILLPILPTIFLFTLFAIFAIRTALQPFDEAAIEIEKPSSSYVTPLPSLKHLPRETRHFGVAINQLLKRGAKHVSSQQLLFSQTIHELRTPLGVMLLEVNKLQGPGARRIECDIKLLTGIINRLLRLTCMDALKKIDLTTIDLTRIVAEVGEHIDPLVKKNNCTLLLRDESPAPFQSEQTAVRDAISNLIENAIKHTPDGTKIIATCGPGSCVTIEDNGPGFPSKEPEDYFKPYNRGTSTVEGSGLGLAIVKEAAELRGGHVKIETSPTGGARVQICFNSNRP